MSDVPCNKVGMCCVASRAVMVKGLVLTGMPCLSSLAAQCVAAADANSPQAAACDGCCGQVSFRCENSEDLASQA
eukprot:2791511-Pleurochrysis_carterae.AAC.2